MCRIRYTSDIVGNIETERDRKKTRVLLLFLFVFFFYLPSYSYSYSYKCATFPVASVLGYQNLLATVMGWERVMCRDRVVDRGGRGRLALIKFHARPHARVGCVCVCVCAIGKEIGIGIGFGFGFGIGVWASTRCSSICICVFFYCRAKCLPYSSRGR